MVASLRVVYICILSIRRCSRGRQTSQVRGGALLMPLTAKILQYLFTVVSALFLCSNSKSGRLLCMSSCLRKS